MRPPDELEVEVFVKLLGDKSATECLWVPSLEITLDLFSCVKSVKDEDLRPPAVLEAAEPRRGEPNFLVFSFRRSGDPSGDVSDFDLFCTYFLDGLEVEAEAAATVDDVVFCC